MHARVRIPDEEILACKEFYEVLHLCLSVSGRGLQEVAWDCGWRDGGKVLSRVVRPPLRHGAARYMPGDKLIPFMLACGNDAPFRWIALKLHPEQARSVESELAEVKETLAELRDDLRRLAGSRPRYSVVSRRALRFSPLLPEWLRSSAADVADRIMSVTIVDDSWQRA